MELKQGENILHTALETALDYKVRTAESWRYVPVVAFYCSRWTTRARWTTRLGHSNVASPPFSLLRSRWTH